MQNQNPTQFSSDVQKVKQEIQSDLQSAASRQSGSTGMGSTGMGSTQGMQSNTMSSALNSQSEAQKVKQDIQQDLQS